MRCGLRGPQSMLPISGRLTGSGGSPMELWTGSGGNGDIAAKVVLVSGTTEASTPAICV